MLLGSAIVANMMQSIAAIPITLRRLRLEKMILYQFGDTLDTDEARARVPPIVASPLLLLERAERAPRARGRPPHPPS